MKLQLHATSTSNPLNRNITSDSSYSATVRNTDDDYNFIYGNNGIEKNTSDFNCSGVVRTTRYVSFRSRRHYSSIRYVHETLGNLKINFINPSEESYYEYRISGLKGTSGRQRGNFTIS